jgi:hypothetical protein
MAELKRYPKILYIHVTHRKYSGSGKRSRHGLFSLFFSPQSFQKPATPSDVCRARLDDRISVLREYHKRTTPLGLITKHILFWNRAHRTGFPRLRVSQMLPLQAG